MKKYLLSLCLFSIFAFQLTGQNSIKLNINHKLADVDFVVNEHSKNNMDDDFNITRLEYYISEISLIHDGGMETLIDDLWILVDASKRTGLNLGEFNITNLEKIKFHIGVDPDHNHLDPTAYEASHPLAPKAPSMHWGWAAGYRFVALEGNGGSNLNQLIQLHGLGDNNYFSTEIDLNLTAENNLLTIDLDADYTKALEDISLNSGVIVHGDNLQAQQCLENFKNYVFTSKSTTSSTVDFGEINSFNIFPNPIVNSETTIKLDLNNSTSKYDITISSIDGQKLQNLKSINDGQIISLPNLSSGMYLVNLIKEGNVVITKKIFVK